MAGEAWQGFVAQEATVEIAAQRGVCAITLRPPTRFGVGQRGNILQQICDDAEYKALPAPADHPELPPMRSSSESRQPRFPVPAPAKRPPPLQPGDPIHLELPLAGPTPRAHWPLERLDGYIACLRDALAQGLNPPLVQAMIENAKAVRREKVQGQTR